MILEFFSTNGRKHCGEKGENAGHQHFLLFPHNVFMIPYFQGLLNFGLLSKV